VNIAILVGGKGKRMNFIEKSMINLCGKRIIDRIYDRFKEFNIVVVCRDEKQKSIFKMPSICDSLRNFGPLAGIHSALRYFKDYTAIIATDMPFVKKEVIVEIFNTALMKKADAVIPVWPDLKLEPLLAVYSPSLVDEIERSFLKNERKILNPVFRLERVFLYDVRCLKKFDKNLISFININTFEDLKRAEEICSSIDLGEE